MIANKFQGWCHRCRCRVAAEAGFLVGRDEASGRWQVLCAGCHATPDPHGSGGPTAFDAALGRSRLEREVEADREARLLAEAERLRDRERREAAARAQAEALLRFIERLAADAAGPSVPACMTTLGVAPPFTVEKVRAAFRTRAKLAHPDHGGSASEFIKVRHAYSDALQYVGGPCR